ncbi:MAG: hypothetical protein ACI4RA_00805 [Kiritimatiellia bacterium]
MRRIWQIAGMAVVACFVATAAVSVPTDVALEMARADVEELTRSDYAALESGRITHTELARSLLDYAKNADDPTAIYLLRRAAFRQYIMGGDIMAAEQHYDQMLRVGGAEYAQALARFSARNLSRQVTAKMVGAKEFMDRLTVMEKKVRNVEAARALAERESADLAAIERYAVSLAVLDDWPAALLQFSRLAGRDRELALFERRYPRTGVTMLTTADVADRWWSYPGTASLAADAATCFRLRAAKWYRLAVTNGVLHGVRRQIAEKRVQEMEGIR